MKAIKITDFIAISLFIVGITLGIIQKFDQEIVAENNVVESISQPSYAIDPAS